MASNFLVVNNFLFEPAGTVAPILVPSVYEPRAVFSINASNQLQGTFWVIKDGVQLVADLGSLSYSILDKDGNNIGISESGILADASGLYQLSPVSAALIQDLTHYTVEILVNAESKSLRGVVAITLGE